MTLCDIVLCLSNRAPIAWVPRAYQDAWEPGASLLPPVMTVRVSAKTTGACRQDAGPCRFRSSRLPDVSMRKDETRRSGREPMCLALGRKTRAMWQADSINEISAGHTACLSFMSFFAVFVSLPPWHAPTPSLPLLTAFTRSRADCGTPAASNSACLASIARR